MTARALIAVAALLALPLEAAAVQLELAVARARDGRIVAAGPVDLHPGEERRIAGQAGELEVSLAVAVREEDPSSVTIDLHARIHRTGSSAPLAWTARSYSLKDGDSISFPVQVPGEDPGFLFSTSRPLPGLRTDGELGSADTRVSLTLIAEPDSGHERILERRELELLGGQPTELVLASPGPGRKLKLRLTALGRDSGGILLRIEARSASHERWQELEPRLGWSDRVHIGGLGGVGGAAAVVLAPVRQR